MARNLRQSGVLPVPTSPVILMKPSPFATATTRVLKASWVARHGKKKLVSGVMPKGASRRPKCADSSTQRLHPAARLAYVLLPVAVRFDYRRLEEDDELLFPRGPVGAAKKASRPLVRYAGNAAARIADVH